MSYDSLPSLKTLFATVTAGVTGTLVYHYMKTNFFAVNDEENIKVSIHVEVPRDTVAYLIGRGGNNIKHIEEETCTSISFIDPGGPCRLGVIRGSKEGVQLAKLQLLKCVEEYGQLETSEIFVSEKTIARLISEERKKLREIAALSKTRIYIDGIQEKPKSLLVRGTYHQIENVRECLKEMAAEEVRSETEIGNNSIVNCVPNPMKTKPQMEKMIDYEKLEPTSFDGFCEVMVSVVESPSKFFVQKGGTLSKELDCLIDDLTEFYSNEDNRLQYAVQKYEMGDLVATLIPDDNCWYRAKVVSIEPDDESEEDESILSVNLVDFGDTILVKQCFVASLRPDFLSIQFQAIQCSMAYIEPKGGVEWTEKAIEAFETLTYCAHWKILMARVEFNSSVNGRNVYCLKLVDTNTEKDIDIATEIVRLEFGSVITQELSM
ncbi:hypothetical protein DAPPUDRAFT_310414 [Daphnia pulex]|uniref:Tudor domain-containing protein n=1 Tax=Daphnia pulex TaxID=6669 RepID=E9FTK1_DAPPU|nr:hypothetical protein DAPPUDRAFT_310414 [Daphnia pulex]|eukprot:EFX89622.1 hypothetical protein DAPPUDRAFT_310414 [Daphnia pulex]